MGYYGLSLIVASLLTGVSCDQLTPREKEMFSLEGRSVTLSYNFSRKATNDYFFWYRQNPGKPPEFLISHTGTGGEMSQPVPGLSFKVSEDKTQMDLLISSAAVSDSAVYYCAVRTSGNKIFFGSGTRLTIEPKEDSEPEVYELTDTKTEQKLCLATGFTRHNRMKGQDEFSETEASQIVEDGKPTGIYNQVAVLDADQTCDTTEKEPNEPCVASLEPDEMVNLASLTVFGLRVIFMKTVVFNVLMTLRLWISQ